MKLIVGLGNFGEKYINTKHNVGFMAIDCILKKINAKMSKSKFDGEVYVNNDFILATPFTYMNNSGVFVSQLVNYYKIAIDDIMIITDDIYTELGKVKVKLKGSAGGHNGISSIIDHLGTSEFKRTKIGISKPLANSDINLADYVLSKFSKDEMLILSNVLDSVSDAILTFIFNDVKIMLNKIYENKK